MGGKYTKEERREYQRVYRQRRRDEAIRLLGGKCVECGSEDDLEFDHTDPKSKAFNISGFSGTKQQLEAELEKCQLLCGEHHKKKTHAQRPARGTRARCGTTYKYSTGCRCDRCREAKRLSR